MAVRNSDFDMIAIGDTTQDVFLEVSDANVQCDLDGANCRICFDYADKIAADTKTDVPAVGNAANHAVGIARLGLRAAVYTVVGDDVQGHLAHDVLRDNGVNTDYIVFDRDHGTNFSAVINYRGERTILVYHEPREYTLPELAATRWVYLTSSSGDGVKQLHIQVLEWLRREPDVQLAFNPGTHQIHLGRQELTPLLSHTTVLFLNREEAAEVLEVTTTDVAELAGQYHALGVTTVVLTDGPDGSYVSDGTRIHHLPIFAGPVVDRTGAGDSYGAGFMGALIQGKDVLSAMLWGNANSTSVVQHIGAREGLLDAAGIEKLLVENSAIVPKEFATL
ncbi:MAG: hypothetical protein COT71_03455 [Candidatus Andersenbacteria bacterium CG10_big_fil_rev_8_21_14_0_10_54_11]|uniref:Carbohydrate kinase PfkB domain-containing protein n=1 Tax=Candidatus Andersenbacteria bacterium CG10_big_fil_rev_8_21_14_0_10_54_11 TaxID=1974485 RepID=A0A2M6WYU5_9BACT|nr:MAG: hypothetical protein COT71_03455 [Candidatus Andersenbacteria bacterium CG10_big_fil_rev_8_21_14_0_10_54_11]